VPNVVNPNIDSRLQRPKRASPPSRSLTASAAMDSTGAGKVEIITDINGRQAKEITKGKLGEVRLLNQAAGPSDGISSGLEVNPKTSVDHWEVSDNSA